MTKINLNDKAHVILTKQGAKLLNLAPYKWPDKVYKEGDKYSSELWDIMNLFGKYLFNGCEIPFKNNIIEMDKDV